MRIPITRRAPARTGGDIRLSLSGEAKRHLLVSESFAFPGADRAYGPLVIEPAGDDRIESYRDYVVMLNDWTDMEPEHIFAILKKSSDYFNFNELTLPDFVRDASMLGCGVHCRRVKCGIGCA
jgi:hypothetical protein